MTDHAPLTDEELAAIEGRAEAATPGPWVLDDAFEVDDNGTTATYVKGPQWWYDNYLESAADAQFIAAARSDVPRLIADLRAARAEVERSWRTINDVEQEPRSTRRHA